MQPRKDYRQVPNFNFIPPEYRRPTLSPQRLSLRLLLVLVIVAEVFFVQNLYQQKSTLQAAINSTQQKIAQVEERIAKIANVSGSEATIKALRQEWEILERDRKELGMEQPNWSQVMSTFFQSQPKGVALDSIQQLTGVVNITGTALNYPALIEYYRKLLVSPVISSINQLKSERVGGVIAFSFEVVVKAGGQ